MEVYLPFTHPRPIDFGESFSIVSRRIPVASTGSSGRPSVLANTLVDPPGRTARAVFELISPLAASFNVPSPPRTTTTSNPSLTDSRVKRVHGLAESSQRERPHDLRLKLSG